MKVRPNTYLFHIIFWAGIYLLWIAVFRSYSVSITRTMSIEFCYLVFITACFYAISSFIIPRFLLQKKYVLFVIFTLITIALAGWLRALVAVQMSLHFFHTSPLPSFHILFLNSLLNIALWVLAITIGKMLIDRVQTQQKLENLEAERIKHELDYLKAQINPHALFNSLNTIYGHIDKSNQVARNTLLQFSELLRYQLYDCGAVKVNLGKELEYIRNYIAFQQLRKDENLKVELDIENGDNDLEIAPLLLVVLIENAFKFVSSYHDKENRISVSLRTNDNVLFGSFFNTTETLTVGENNVSNGIGIANLKRRLELLYKGKYELVTKAETDFYETKLTLNLA